MTTLLREVIGDVLRRARVEQGRTLREVSDSARVSLGYLSEVERGRKEASSELLSAICGALDVPLSRVLSDAGDEMALEESRGAITTAAEPSAPPTSTSPPRSSFRRSCRWRSPDTDGLVARLRKSPRGCGDLRGTDRLGSETLGTVRQS